ncbi:MAG: bi-domain-containing oxidoreductase [Candidatus Binatales bacterium]
MKQVIKDNRGIRVEEVPQPTLREAGILVRTAASVISAGTERSAVRSAAAGYLALARERPDLARQAIHHARQAGLIKTYQAIRARRLTAGPLGYSAAGVVTEVTAGLDEFRVGDRVACAGAGYANHAEHLFVPRNLAVKLPETVSFEAAAFTTVGAVAMHGLRLSQSALGARIAVIGLGLVGQIVVQLARASGCYVIGFDPDRRRVDRALELGMEAGTAEAGPGAIVEAEGFSGGRGVDAVIIAAATASNEPVTLAGEIARPRAEVVVIGSVGMAIPRELYYRKELALRVAMSYGPGRYDPLYEEGGIDYPFAYVRWTERRNLQAFVELLAARRIDVAPLITHRFPAAEAERAYCLLDSPDDGALGIVLNYPLCEHTARDRGEVVLDHAVNGTRARIDGRLRIGLIGAGVFAKAVILPALKRIPNAAITAVATASGINAREAAAALGAAYASTDYRRILADPEIDAVIALTRHDSHAAIVAEALRQGKPVFVEKPLCLDRESLAMLNGEYRQALERAGRTGSRRPLVMVGFNRRFSPHALRLRDEIAKRPSAILIQYRVNAGALPATSWMQDRRISGGRLIGEACHFIDLMQFLAGCEPSRIFCEALPTDDRSPAENFLLTIRFGDGSAATLTYSALGDVSAGKERIELYCGQRLYVIEDFKTLTAFAERRRRTLVNRSDKGHERELASFIEAVRSGTEPVPFDSYVATTLTTFAAVDSISSREPVDIASAWPAEPLDAQPYRDRGAQ